MRYNREHRRHERNVRLRVQRALRREEIARAERERRDAIKRLLIERRGGACVRCRATPDDLGHVAAFDFHHVVPSTKSFNVCGNYGRSWSSLCAEVDKCEVLCACCHRIVEATLENPSRRRGRPPKSWASQQEGVLARIAEHTRREELRRAAERGSALRGQLELL